MPQITRRQFLIYAGAGAGVVLVGGAIARLGFRQPGIPVQALDIHISDAMKEMVTHNAINEAKCYFWIYKYVNPDLMAECPGPTIVAMKGDEIQLSLTNDLDEPHAFSIPGIFDSGAIAPGQTVMKAFTVNKSGGFMYFDNLNPPVNRVMGLHGALLVLPPEGSVAGHKTTPYDDPTPNVQAIFDSFGSTTFPGLAWENGDAATKTPAFRRYVWLCHQASPHLFEQVGRLPAGQIFPAEEFVRAFTADPFTVNNSSRTPQYFTINGQSGFFSHFDPVIIPQGRVGEPVVVHIMNAGLWTHSMHLHGNHFYLTSVDGVVQENPLWLDTMALLPMRKVDYTVPYMRPPDVPNARGIGRPDTALTSPSTGKPVWPPVEEFDVFLPAGKIAKDINGNNIDLKQRQSPLCYPMHNHSEPTQTSQGGNYNNGDIAGMYLVGDRNTMMDFPMEHDFAMMFRNIRGVSKTSEAPGIPPVK